jgi:glycosyltransferase involved in cell wall biosynthesis
VHVSAGADLRDDPLRVLYLNPFSQEVSGPDESLRTLLAALIPLGVEAHLVLPRPGPQVSRYEALGVKVHYAPLTILSRRPGPGAALLPLRLARGAAAVARIARRERIDVVHTNMEVVLDGAVAAWLLRLPHVLHYRGNTNDDPKVVFDALTLFWTATAARVFCISSATAEIFRKRGLGEKVEVLYNPVDVEAFAGAARSDEVRRELGAGPADLLVGTVGRLHPRKDVATFLRAGASLARSRPDVRLAVVGSAEAPEEVCYARELRALAASLGIADRVIWAGARRDMPRVLKALDVFVLCSRNEGFGRVVAEAMVAGTPVVASDEGAMPELAALSRGAVALAPPMDADGFAKAALGASPGGPDPRVAGAFAARTAAEAVHRSYVAALSA